MNSSSPQPLNSRKLPLWMWLLAVVSVIAIVWGMWRALDARSAKKQLLDATSSLPAASLTITANDYLILHERVLPLGIAITGNLTAVESAVIKARVPGELRDLQVREGDTVKRGQVIARVDATESEARYRQAKLQADAANAQVAIQQRQYDNNRKLVDQGFISDTALATSVANLQAAQANYAAARAAQDGAQKTLDDTVLRSPIHGQVARRMVQNGERVNVEAPVLEVVNLSSLELQAQLPANDSAQVKIGQTAQLQLRTSNHQTPLRLQAQVVRINPSASQTNRSVPVYLRLQPHETTALRPGMYVEGFIQTGEVRALAVPLSAVRTDQPIPYVQTVHNNVVQHSSAQLGVQSMGDTTTWVAIEGLQPGQIVLTGSNGAIAAGTRVALQSHTPANQPHTEPPANTAAQ